MALVRGLVGYAPAVIVPRLLMLAQITLLTRFIPQAEFGLLVLVMTVGDAIDALCCNWIRTVLGRFGAGKTDGLAEEAAQAFIAYALFAGALALPAALVVAHYVPHVQPAMFFACIAGYLLTNGIARNALTLLALRGKKLAFFTVEVVRTGLGFAAVMTLAATDTVDAYWPLAMVMNAAAGLAAVIGDLYRSEGSRTSLAQTLGVGQAWLCDPAVCRRNHRDRAQSVGPHGHRILRRTRGSRNLRRRRHAGPAAARVHLLGDQRPHLPRIDGSL